jgi:hypothetical protein
MVTPPRLRSEQRELRDMSFLLSKVFVFGFGLAVGVLTIVSTLLHRADITWRFINPHGSRRRPLRVVASLSPAPAWS